MMRLIIQSLLVVLFSQLYAQTESYPKVGEQAPDIHLEKVLKYRRSNLSLNDFRNNKIVILEFWATWCAPCIPAMSHLDKLQKKFKEDLVVITITLENSDKIQKFLKKMNLGLLIGIDSDSSCFKTYKPQTIPHSVVIDKKGKIIGITRPGEITEEKIQNLLDGTTVTFEPKERRKELKEEKEISDSLYIYYVKFRKALKNEATLLVLPDKKAELTASGFTLPMILQQAYRLPSYNRIVFDVKDPAKYEYGRAQKYYFSIKIPETKKDSIYSIMIAELKRLAPFNFRLEKRKMKVKALKVEEDGKLKKSKSENTVYAFRGPELTAKNISMEKFATYLENFSNYPVVDNTGLQGKYDIDFKWSYADKDSFYRELKRLGLKLETEECKIEVLVISE